VPEIDTWVRTLAVTRTPATVRRIVGVFRRLVGKARGQYELPPINWDLISTPTVSNEHAEENRLTEEQVAKVLPIVHDKFPYYAPVIFVLYSTGLRYSHVVATRWAKLTTDGVLAIEQMYDYSENKFRPVSEKKKAPPMIALEPRTLELVRSHRRYLMEENHPGLATGLLFPSERGTRPVGNDQLNDVWRESQIKAGVERPVTIHGIRHTFHDMARQEGVPDAVVKAMAGRAGSMVMRGGSDKHLHYSRGVTVEEMRQASIAVMRIVPTRPGAGPESRDGGRDARGRDRSSDEEVAAPIGT
jgi:integrase